MKILVWGSLNLDYTYDVEHFVRAGETIASLNLNEFVGGKGLNQSLALLKAGGEVYHAGCIGNDGMELLSYLNNAGVNTDYINVNSTMKTGHAIIQRDKDGDNCILIYSGANKAIDKAYVDQVLNDFEKEDIVVLQNEISEVPYIVEQANEKGMQIVLNPSPIDETILNIDLAKVDYLILNQIEALQILGSKEDGIKEQSSDILVDLLIGKYPELKIVLTIGSEGSIYRDNKNKIFQESFKVQTKDTTAAGDTFLGYFMAICAGTGDIKKALETASKAAAAAVGKRGAAGSIPSLDEL